MSSSVAWTGMASEPAEALRLSFWAKGGMPVMGSSFVLRVLIDHDGVMRRSDDEFSEITRKGTSAMFAVAVAVAVAVAERQGRGAAGFVL